MARQFDAVLFDFGGVFMASPFAAVATFGEQHLGLPGTRVLEYVFGQYDQDNDHPWHRLERGEIALDVARQDILDLAARDGHEVDIFRALSALGGAALREPMVDAVRAARAAGCRTAIVTNNIREFGQGWRRMLPIDELFDAVIDSHEVGVRKPDPRIYTLALERLGGVEPARTVFLDDFQGNVTAAERLGLRGVLVEDAWERAIDTLRELLAHK